MRNAVVDIYGLDGIVKCETIFKETSIRHFELMKSDYIRLDFNLSKNIAIVLGDYIVTEYGRFEVTDAKQKPTYNIDNSSYDYKIQFDAEYWKWNNKLFKFSPKTNRNEATWSLTDKLETHMQVFLANLESHGWTDYIVDVSGCNSEKINQYVYISYDNVYLVDALNMIAEKFEVEWWVVGKVIYFGRKEHGTAIDFVIGKNVVNMTAESESQNKKYTKFFAFGSDRNIPSNYRVDDTNVVVNGVAQKRLMLPATTPFVTLPGADKEENQVECIVIFDQEYPKMDNSITDVMSKVVTMEKSDDGEDGESTEQVTVYRFKDTSLSFSKDYIKSGVQLQVIFQTGKLSGMQFDLAFNPDGASEKILSSDGAEVWNEDSQWFEVVINDTYGISLPNETLRPEVGDKYILIGWDAKKMETGLGLITDAENALLQDLQDYIIDLQIDANNYTCSMMADYMYGLDKDGNQDSTFTMVGKFEAGQRINLVNSNFFESGSRSSRVIGYEYKLDIPFDDAKIIVGEKPRANAFQSIKASINAKVDSVSYGGNVYNGAGSTIGGGRVYLITSNDTTVETDSNAYSAKRTKQQFAQKDRDDKISSLWTFTNGYGKKRGIQSHEYYGNETNEDNIFGKGFELINNINGKSRLEIDELFVRIKAYFADLEIRKLSYVGGNYLFSCAGSKICYVKDVGAAYRCYFYSDDGTTATMNYWKVGDQARCQQFNIDAGRYTNVENRFYWRLVTNVGSEVLEDGKTYQYADLSKTDCAESSDAPFNGDIIVQEGYRYDDNSRRQGVVFIDVESENSPAIYEYSGINSYTLPSPTLQLSPKKNIIFGEFHSVANGAGNNKSIDDQLKEILSMLELVKTQTDQKFDIWLYDYIPLPNASDRTSSNVPASDWEDDLTKAEHVQDLFYNTLKEPGSGGGRAYRYIKDENGYYWDEITDQDTIAALEQAAQAQETANEAKDEIALITSDGILSRVEKKQVLKEWEEIVRVKLQNDSLAALFNVRSSDFGMDSDGNDILTQYDNSFLSLGQYMNGDKEAGATSSWDGTSTPSWLSDLTTDQPIDAVLYRKYWTDYYNAESVLLNAINSIAKKAGDDALKSIEEIVSDGVLDPSEKQTIKRDFVAAYHEKNDDGGLIDKGHDASAKWLGGESGIIALAGNDYVSKFRTLGTLLNGSSAWTEPSLSDFVDSTLPLWIQDDRMSASEKDIDSELFRTVWANFYSARSEYMASLSKYAQETANENTAVIDAIADDSKLTGQEKLSLIREFEAIVSERPVIEEKASGAHVDFSSYETSFTRLSTYLNNGAPWESGTPEMLTENGITDIDGTDFRSYWNGYYTEKSRLLTAISNAHISVFVSTPSIPYYVGDMWVQEDGNFMVCITERTTGEFTISDWTDLSDLADQHDPTKLMQALAEKIYNEDTLFSDNDVSAKIYLGVAAADGLNGTITLNGNIGYISDGNSFNVASDGLTAALRGVYNILGSRTITVSRSSESQSSGERYDLNLRVINGTDPLTQETIERWLEVFMYDGSTWVLISEVTTKGFLDNLGSEIRAIVIGDNGDGTIGTSGFVTKNGFASVFSQTVDSNGDIARYSGLSTWMGQNDYLTGTTLKSFVNDQGFIKEASLEAYVRKVDDGNGGYTLESGVTIAADRIDFIGKTTINGNFVVDNDGNVTMENCTVNGVIHASAGYIGGNTVYNPNTSSYENIGGFSIQGNGLTNIVPQSSMSQSDMAYIICRNDYYGRFAGIGANVLPSSSGSAAVARFENTDTHTWYGSNIAMLLQAENGTYNYAFIGKGDGILNGDIIGYKYQDMTCSSDTIIETDYSKGSKIFFSNFVSNSGLALPTLDNIRRSLGTGSTTKFAVFINYIQKFGSTTADVVFGKNNSIFSNKTISGIGNTATIINSDGSKSTLTVNSDGTIKVVTGSTTTTSPSGTVFRNYWMNDSKYPQMYDNDKNTINSISMGIGDLLTIMLLYDGSNYMAFIVNKNWGI